MLDIPTKLHNELVRDLGRQLAAEGYVVYYDSAEDRMLAFTTNPPQSVSRSDMCETLRQRALAYFDAIAADPTPRIGRSAAKEAARTLRSEPATRWLRLVDAFVRDELPELDDEQLAELRAAMPRPEARTRTRPATYWADNRAANKTAAVARAKGILTKWLASARVSPGKHTLPELWTQWQAEILPTAQRLAPEVARMGRNTFYTAVAEVAEVRTGAGGTRYIVVAHDTPQ